jgi:hypothetical protein
LDEKSPQKFQRRVHAKQRYSDPVTKSAKIYIHMCYRIVHDSMCYMNISKNPFHYLWFSFFLLSKFFNILKCIKKIWFIYCYTFVFIFPKLYNNKENGKNIKWKESQLMLYRQKYWHIQFLWYSHMVWGVNVSACNIGNLAHWKRKLHYKWSRYKIWRQTLNF